MRKKYFLSAIIVLTYFNFSFSQVCSDVLQTAFYSETSYKRTNFEDDVFQYLKSEEFKNKVLEQSNSSGFSLGIITPEGIPVGFDANEVSRQLLNENSSSFLSYFKDQKVRKQNIEFLVRQVFHPAQYDTWLNCMLNNGSNRKVLIKDEMLLDSDNNKSDYFTIEINFNLGTGNTIPIKIKEIKVSDENKENIATLKKYKKYTLQNPLTIKLKRENKNKPMTIKVITTEGLTDMYIVKPRPYKSKIKYFKKQLEITSNTYFDQGGYDLVIFDSTNIHLYDPNFDNLQLQVLFKCKAVMINGFISVSGNTVPNPNNNPNRGRDCDACLAYGYIWDCGGGHGCAPEDFDRYRGENMGHQGPKGFKGEVGPKFTMECDTVFGDYYIVGIGKETMRGGQGSSGGGPGSSRACRCNGKIEAYAANNGNGPIGDEGDSGEFVFINKSDKKPLQNKNSLVSPSLLKSMDSKMKMQIKNK